MILLDIQPQSRKGSYLWEHALKSAMGLLGTFGGIFFLFFFSGAKSRNSHFFADMIVFFFDDHVEITVLICLAAATIFNLTAFVKNRQQIYIVKLDFNEQNNTLCFDMISVYNDKTAQKIINLKDCLYFEKSISEFLIGKHEVIAFADSNQTEFACIDPSHEIHKKFEPKIKAALRELNSLKSRKTS